MKLWPAFTAFLVLYVARASGQTIYDAYNFYKPMTDYLDVRQHGQLFLPGCIKNLLDCWEVVKPDLVCKYGRTYRIALESMCMDLRFQCVEFTGPLPFQTANVTTWNYCAPNVTAHDKIDRLPLSPGININENEK